MVREVPSPSLQPWLTLLILSALGSGILLWQIRPDLLEFPRGRSRPSMSPSETRAEEREPRRVRLLYVQEGTGMLTPVERSLGPAPTLADAVRAVLQELATGGLPGLRSPLFPGTEVRQVFVDAFGVAYLDFNRAFLETVTALPPVSEASISALVRTLTDSFSEIKRAHLLADG